MRYRQYKFKFYLNFSHAIYINGTRGEEHPHTWEIAINTLKLEESFIPFNELEKEVEEFLCQYQDEFINQIAPFDVINPTLENCCDYFKEQISNILNSEGWILLLIELSESPTRSYIINLLDDEASDTVKTVESLTDRMIETIINA